ncbi:MAG: DUF2270 domain-containing protein [Anaerolineae bacterium]|jgi:uncharacterized membrane protein/uncharacterized protein YaaQ
MVSQESEDEREFEDAGSEPVWRYRGYELKPGQFTTAMVHLFRAEVQRANVWRQRLDTTTNWAVVTTGAAISFAYSRTQVEDHRLIILNVLLVTLFLYIEARRYRYYELWSYRVRLMETDFFATMLVPPFRPADDWAESLAENLLHPQYPISILEALGRRLRRNYIWIYIILDLAWLSKVWLHPSPALSWQQFISRAAIGTLAGEAVLAVGMVLNAILLLISLLTVGLQRASGEVLPRYGILNLPGLSEQEPAVPRRLSRLRAWFRPSRRRQQLLALIITDRAQAVADRILCDMRRGVTALPGTGMYTREGHTVLLCALTVTEVARLKALVRDEDERAFVTLTPAQEVLGTGFAPLREECETG